MASVYLATHESLDRHVALKLLRRFDTSSQTKRFLREGRILAGLHHNSVITIFDIGMTEARQPYISMEYLEGGDLEARIKSGMTPEEAIKVVDSIADCLDLVHKEGIIHRDIKPANILFHKNGTAVLSDFGIAKQENRDTQLTMEGSAFGSPYYLSPEQAECKTLDGRADIYGLGIVLYEMLTGEKPYKGNSHIETIVAHMSDALPVLPEKFGHYQELLNKMIAKSPADRFPNAGDVVLYIRELLESESAIQTANSKQRTDSALPNKKSSSLKNTHSGKENLYQNSSLSRTEKTLWSLSGILMVLLIVVGSYIFRQQHIKVTSAPIVVSTMPATNENVSGDKGTTTENHSISEIDEILPQNPMLSAGMSKTTSRQDAKLISEYLTKADHALDDFRLVNPKKNNAEYFYKQILSIDDHNKDALNGFKKIANIYANLAEGELNRFNYTQANRYIHKGLRIQPDNRRLLKLRDTADVFTDAPKRALDKIKSIFN